MTIGYCVLHNVKKLCNLLFCNKIALSWYTNKRGDRPKNTITCSSPNVFHISMQRGGGRGDLAALFIG